MITTQTARSPDHCTPLFLLLQGHHLTTIKTAGTSSITTRAKPTPKDAIALLRADHAAVSQMFADYENTRSIQKKKALVADICTALSLHAQIEEAIFYPAVKGAPKNKVLVHEATVEHTGVKDLIAQLEGIKPDGEMYEAKVRVLSEHLKRHLKEEQTEIRPRAKASSLDMTAPGQRMAARKEDLLAQTD